MSTVSASWEDRRFEIYEVYLRHGRNASRTADALECHKDTVLKYARRVEKREPERAAQIAGIIAGQPIIDNSIDGSSAATAARVASLREELARLESQAGAQFATRQTDSPIEEGGQIEPPPFVSEVNRPRVAPAVIVSPHYEEWRTSPDRKDTDVYRVLCTPDAQVPYHDTVAESAVEQYAAENRYDEWVDLGDFLDLDFLSRHNIGKHRQNAGKLLKEHYAAGREVLDRRLKILRANNPEAAMTLIEGNHDYRAEAFIDENPHLEGMIEVEAGLGLQERDVRWIRFWRDGTLYQIGKAFYAHGRYISKYHAAKMVETYCENIFYGHVHDVMEFPKIMHGQDKVIVGQSLGCLCRYDQSYIKENPKNWQQAFAEFFFLPSGHFTYYVPRIIAGRFVAPNGKIYNGWRD